MRLVAEPAFMLSQFCARPPRANSQGTPRIQKPILEASAFDAQKHLRWTIVGPLSSYSVLEIHICWKVERDDKMLPPIHTEYLRSGGAITLIFMVDGARAVSSFVMRSPIPANIVVPPDRTTFAYKSLRISTSHFMIDWKVVSWMPLASLPMKDGWKRTSGHRKRSLPTVITLPSGSSYLFSFSELSAAAFISVSKSSATYDSFSFTSSSPSPSSPPQPSSPCRNQAPHTTASPSRPLLLLRALRRSLHLRVEIKRHIRRLLLHVLFSFSELSAAAFISVSKSSATYDGFSFTSSSPSP